VPDAIAADNIAFKVGFLRQIPLGHSVDFVNGGWIGVPVVV